MADFGRIVVKTDENDLNLTFVDRDVFRAAHKALIDAYFGYKVYTSVDDVLEDCRVSRVIGKE